MRENATHQLQPNGWQVRHPHDEQPLHGSQGSEVLGLPVHGREVEMQDKPTILILEDEDRWLALLRIALGKDFEPVFVAGYEEARAILRSLPKPPWAVVLDGYIGEETDESFALLRHLLDVVKFSGPIIGVSSDSEVRAQQLQRGCTHVSEKPELRDFLPRLLS